MCNVREEERRITKIEEFEGQKDERKDEEPIISDMFVWVLDITSVARYHPSILITTVQLSPVALELLS